MHVEKAEELRMLQQLIGATATSLVARQIGGVAAGPAGAILGMALPFVARRLGPAGMVALAVAAWAMKRVLDDEAKKAAAETAAPDAGQKRLPAV